LTTTPTNYRIFIGAFLSGDLAERIQAIRVRLDPKSAKNTMPHVTLAGTYTRIGLPTPGSEAEAISRLCTLHNSVEPFDLVLSGVRTFPPAEQPVIYLHVESTPGLLAARQVIMDQIGPDKHKRFIPHLTLGTRLQGESARRALNTLKTSDLATHRFATAISELRLMQRGPVDSSWRCIATFSLTGNHNSNSCVE